MVPLVLNLLFFAYASSESCGEAFKNEVVSLIDLITKTSDDMGPVLRFYYSGKDANDLGHYESCIRRSDSRYLMATTMVENIPVSVGLCVPKACDAASFTELLQVDTPFFFIWEPATQSMHSGGVITLVLLGLLALLVLISSFVKNSDSLLSHFSLRRNWKELVAEPVQDQSRILN